MTLRPPLLNNQYGSISLVKKKKRAAETKGSAPIASGFVPLNLLTLPQGSKVQSQSTSILAGNIRGIITQSRLAHNSHQTELASSLGFPSRRDYFAQIPSTRSRDKLELVVTVLGAHKIMPAIEHEPLASRILEYSEAKVGWYETFVTTSNLEIRIEDHLPYALVLEFTRIECSSVYFLNIENSRPQMRAARGDKYIYFGIGSRVILLPALAVGKSIERIFFSRTRTLMILKSRDYYLITHNGRDANLRAFFNTHHNWGIGRCVTELTLEEDALSSLVKDYRHDLATGVFSLRFHPDPIFMPHGQSIAVEDIDLEDIDLNLDELTSNINTDAVEEIPHPNTQNDEVHRRRPLQRRAPNTASNNLLIRIPPLTDKPSGRPAPIPIHGLDASSNTSSSEHKEAHRDSCSSNTPVFEAPPAETLVNEIDLYLRPSSRNDRLSSSLPTCDRQEPVSVTSGIVSSGSGSPTPTKNLSSSPLNRSSVVVSPAENSITVELGLQTPAPFYPDLKHRFLDNNTFTVTYNDFKTLYNNEWINDSLIDFFVEYEIEAAVALVPDLNRDQVYAFNSFFFTKLVSNSIYQDLPDYYANVKRWLQKVDLMKYDLVVIPINENAHWYACVIKGLPKLLEHAIAQKAMESAIDVDDYEYKEDSDVSLSKIASAAAVSNEDVTKAETIPSENAESEGYRGSRNRGGKRLRQVAEIYVFDSLCQKHSSIKNPLISFLTDYCKENFDIDVGTAHFKFIYARVPRQNNFNDCGVHVIYNIRKWLGNMDSCEAAWRMLYPKNLVPIRRIFPADERGTMRSQLIDILLGLHAKQFKEGTCEKTRSMHDKDHEGDDDDDIEVIGVSEVQVNVSLDDSCLPLRYTRNQAKADQVAKSRSMLASSISKAGSSRVDISANNSNAKEPTRTLDPRASRPTLPSKPVSPVSVQPRKSIKKITRSKDSSINPSRQVSPYSRTRAAPFRPPPKILNDSIRAKLSKDKTGTSPHLVTQLNVWFRNRHTVHPEETLEEVYKLHLRALKLSEPDLIAACDEFSKHYQELRGRKGDPNRPRNQDLVITDSEPLGYGDDWGLIQPHDLHNEPGFASDSNGKVSSRDELNVLSDDGSSSVEQVPSPGNEVLKRRRIQVSGVSTP